MSDERKNSPGFFGVKVEAASHGHCHVGLAGSEPYLTHEDVFGFNFAAFIAARGQAAGLRTSRKRIELECPFPVGAGFG